MNRIIRYVSVLLAVLLAFSSFCAAAAAEESETVVLLSPAGTAVIHTALQDEFLSGPFYKIRPYAGGVDELSRPEPVTFTWSDPAERGSFVLEISETEDFADPLAYTVTGETAEVFNLKTGTTYYYRIDGTDGVPLSETGVFVTDGSGPRNLYIDGVTNARDIGSYKTRTGNTVRQGMLIRCGKLDNITDEGRYEMLENLGIRSEIDLRMAVKGETSRTGTGALGTDVNYFVCPMDYHGTFLENFLLEDNKAALKKVFEVLSDEDNYPICFHCSIGTDRTGFVAHIIEGLLGVEEEDIFRDYLFSNFGKIGSSRSVADICLKYPLVFDLYRGKTLSEKIYNYLAEIIGVPTEQLDSFISIVTENNGDAPVIDPSNRVLDLSLWNRVQSSAGAVIRKIVLFFYGLFNDDLAV